jgi:hydroxyethylthiazole kinase-like uncharacterized protein yjeF
MEVLYRTAELRALEARAQADLPTGTLMQRAGEAAAGAIDRAWPHRFLRSDPGGGTATRGKKASILVLCGPGNNGGDGFATAIALQRRGHACLCWAPLASATDEATAVRQQWAHFGGKTVADAPEAGSFDLAVDAILGIGGSRPLAGTLLAALRWVEQHGVPMAALDLPSGIDADTGEWLGGIAGSPSVLTVSFLGDKTGLHLRDALEARGDLHIDRLGVDRDPRDPLPAGRLNGPGGFRPLLLRRAPDVNKGSYGTVAVAGGASGMVGAALLAGRAALRMGAGKVFVDCLGAPALAVDPMQPELMLQSGRTPGRGEVLVAGCGMGREPAATARLPAWIAHEGPVVFDADALNAVAGDAALRSAIRARGRVTVLTPHPGEAARLLQTDTASVQRDRVASALRLAEALQAIVVLKGAGTVVADPSGAFAINTSGGPALATAGTGDVLAGIAGALLAQFDDALAAVRAAVWLHGRAAELHGSDVGLCAADVAPLAARAWEQARAGQARTRPGAVSATP